MIFVQNLRRQSEVDLVFGPGVPGELRHPLEERSDDLVLGGLWTRALQALEFPLNLRLLLLLELQRPDPFPELLNVVPFVFVAQLALDLLELLAQQHLPLPLAKFLLHPGLDFLLGVEPCQLALYGDEGLTHSLLVVEHFQQRLLVFGFDVQIEGHEIGERSRLIHTLDQVIESVGRNPPSGAQLGGAFPQFIIERLKNRILGILAHLALHLEENRAEHPFTLGFVGNGLCPLLALYQKLHSTPGPVGLDDPYNRPDPIEHVR